MSYFSLISLNYFSRWLNSTNHNDIGTFILIFSLLLVFSNTYFISFIMGNNHILSSFNNFKFFFLV